MLSIERQLFRCPVIDSDEIAALYPGPSAEELFVWGQEMLMNQRK